jgi:hypothetical protein
MRRPIVNLSLMIALVASFEEQDGWAADPHPTDVAKSYVE